MPPRSRSLAILRCTFVLTAGLAAARGDAATAEPEPAGRVEERIVVREAETRVDLSVLPPLESIGRRGVEDFLLLEDGAERRLIRIDEEPEPAGWSVLIWFDSRLADGPARAASARTLASRAEALVARGEVEVVVVDDDGEPLRRGPYRNAHELAIVLVGLARAADEVPARVEPEVALGRLDRLVDELGRRGAGAQRCLLLPASGWRLDVAHLDELGRARRDEGTASARVAPLFAAARALAAGNWVVFTLALRPAPAPTDPSVRRDQAQVVRGAGGDQQTIFPVLRFPFRRERPTAAEAARLEAATDLTLAPLGDLARVSSGALVGHEDQLEEVLGRLFGRARIVFAASAAVPGRVVRRALLWSAVDGRALPMPALWSAGPAPEVAAARLRRRLAGATAPGAGALAIEALAGEAAVCLATGVERATVRLSSARPGTGAEALVVGEPIALQHDDGPRCVAWPAAAGDGQVWIAEDLDRGDWLAR